MHTSSSHSQASAVQAFFSCARPSTFTLSPRASSLPTGSWEAALAQPIQLLPGMRWD